MEYNQHLWWVSSRGAVIRYRHRVSVNLTVRVVFKQPMFVSSDHICFDQNYTYTVLSVYGYCDNRFSCFHTVIYKYCGLTSSSRCDCRGELIRFRLGLWVSTGKSSYHESRHITELVSFHAGLLAALKTLVFSSLGHVAYKAEAGLVKLLITQEYMCTLPVVHYYE